MSIEEMKLALDALESWQKTCLDCGRGSDELGRATKPIVALRQAIEQAEKQEPVAWLVEFENGEQELHFDEQSVGETQTPLYTAPPPRKPLTEEEISAIDWKDGETLHDFARAIERAHGIRGQL